jgi:parvulin-like peptidyl-prolyl isomerase
MTVRAKPVVKRAHRSSWRDEDRRGFFLNVGFGIVVIAAIVILVFAAAASWYRENLEPVGSVNGQAITKDDLRKQAQIEDFKLELEAARIREELTAGRITREESESLQEQVTQQRNQVTTTALTRLIDSRVQEVVAVEQSIDVTEEQIQAQIAEGGPSPSSASPG